MTVIALVLSLATILPPVPGPTWPVSSTTLSLRGGCRREGLGHHG